MKVFMLGWEFPPYHSGGLGTACFGLTKGLANKGVEVTFVLPTLKDNIQAEFVKLVGANIKFTEVKSPLVGYMTTNSYSYTISKTNGSNFYGQNLLDEVERYAKRITDIAIREDFDIIHAHDWLTFPAAIKAKKATNKPLVVHVHATEFDRCASDNVNPEVFKIELEGMNAADSIIAVSHFTRNMIINHYGIAQDKVTVVHNGVEFKHYAYQNDFGINKDDKVVLFLGRITIQKGPDYFLYSAAKVLEHMSNVKFVVAGSGDMEPYIIHKAAEMGLGKNMLFTGFLRGKDVDMAYKMADVYVMPSVSEPFGITPLESMIHGTPTIISKQSGVSEVVTHTLKVDFWDTHELANQIISILKYPPLSETLSENAYQDVHNINWNESARKCVDVYNATLGARPW